MLLPCCVGTLTPSTQLHPHRLVALQQSDGAGRGDAKDTTKHSSSTAAITFFDYKVITGASTHRQTLTEARSMHQGQRHANRYYSPLGRTPDAARLDGTGGACGAR